MITALALVLVPLALGKLCQRTGAFPDGAAEVLNRFVSLVCLPALILVNVPGLTWRLDLVFLVAAPWLFLPVGAGVTWLAARAFGWPRGTLAALLAATLLGNTAFLGYPYVVALLGPDRLRYAVVFDQFGTFLQLSTFALIVVTALAGRGRPRPAEMLRRVLTFPPFLALLVALLPWTQPEWLQAALRALAAALVPVAVFAVGLNLRFTLPREELGPLAFGLGVKLVLFPLVVFGLGRLLGADEALLDVAILQAAMPPMITAAALAAAAGHAPRLAAALVGYGILVSAGLLPLLAHWLT